jgi:D-glycero-D-manno-heptose 1,7-bisphosphate phosphatase
MKLFLLDRDGVVVVNRRDNIKSADKLALIPGAAEAIARLNSAGWSVALCTNQPEVGRGAMTKQQLAAVHKELEARLAETGARLDLILCCTSSLKCPTRKPAGGMLRRALAHFGAVAAETPFVGDQADDLKAAFHAGCQRVLVRTGLGSKTLAQGLPAWLAPVEICDGLAQAVDRVLAQRRSAHQRQKEARPTAGG